MIPDVSAHTLVVENGLVVGFAVVALDLPADPVAAVAHARRRPHRFRVFTVPSIAVTCVQDRDSGAIRTIPDSELVSRRPDPRPPDPDPRPQPPVPSDEETPE